jgi:hypothetical protein
MDTPVVLFIFNRAHTTERVMEVLAKVRPKNLWVIADGPRANGTDGERQSCERTRAIATRVDWDCNVLTNFAEENLGCQKRIVGGLDWVFNRTEQAIILEDDCLPVPDFFRFCEEILAKYNDNPRIAMVSGNCYLPPSLTPRTSYYFSRHSYTWGWATWRRAWMQFDVGIEKWRKVFDEDWLVNAIGSKEEARFWAKLFDSVIDGGKGTIWDYQWFFSNLSHGQFSVTPSVNLVSNIGFGEGATHTQGGANRLADRPTFELSFPLQHPSEVVWYRSADDYVFKNVYNEPRRSLLSRVKRKIFGIPFDTEPQQAVARKA